MPGPDRFFSFKFGSDAAAHQSSIMQLLKSQGHDCIQTSDGLCVKASIDQGELEKILNEKELAAGVAIEPVSTAEDQPKDVQVFMGKQ